MEGDTEHRCGVLGMLLERIVDDIFDSSCSDSSSEDDESSDSDDSHEMLDCKKEPETSSRTDSPFRRAINLNFNIPLDPLPPCYDADDFKKRFKISQETFSFLLNLIEKDLLLKTYGAGSRPIPPPIQLLIALRKMGSSESYRKICEEFSVGKTSTSRAVTRVIQAISSHSSRFIVWPKDNRIQEVCRGFQTLSSIPKVIGSLGSTHINIPEPPPSLYVISDAAEYQHSVRLEAVVDHEGRFIHCSIGPAGRKMKQDEANNSAILDQLPDSSAAFPDDCHLVAGPEHDLHEHVMVAYSDRNLTKEQEGFNEHLDIAHACVTVAFSILKGRFASLRQKLDMFRLDLIPIYLMACCVLHNICLDRKDIFTGPTNAPLTEPSSMPQKSEAVPTPRALKKRDTLCRQVYLSKAEGFVFV